jgi:hypothetical protein
MHAAYLIMCPSYISVTPGYNNMYKQVTPSHNPYDPLSGYSIYNINRLHACIRTYTCIYTLVYVTYTYTYTFIHNYYVYNIYIPCVRVRLCEAFRHMSQARVWTVCEAASCATHLSLKLVITY